MIYSKIFVYYSLMTSRRWLVERDELNVGELLSFPIPFPTENEITEACHLYDINCKSSKIAEETIDEFAYKIYKLKKYEIEFVEDAVSYIYDYFYVKGKSKSLASVNEEDLKHYQEVLINILKKSLGNSEKMVSNYYSNEVPLTIVQEVGTKGSDSVSGTYPGYQGYYNFYNYSASDGGSPIEKGLNYMDSFYFVFLLLI